jgi:hypothetical protein
MTATTLLNDGRDVRNRHETEINLQATGRVAPILLQKSKIEQREKPRESGSRGFSAAASLVSGTAEICGRFWMKRYGPSRRRA